MKRYSVALPFYLTHHIEVEAESIDDAWEIASENAFPSVCHQCSGEVEVGEIDSAILDEWSKEKSEHVHEVELRESVIADIISHNE